MTRLRHRKRIALRGACASLLLVGSVAPALAGEPESAAELLQRLEVALATRNYQGVFVHVQGDQTETLRIVHRVSNGRVDERLVSLDGSGREFIRSGDEIHYYLPDQKLVLVEKSADPSSLLPDLKSVDTTASGRYQLRELQSTRASGRATRVIAVEPKDAYRYGYRLWIDESSAMPVKSQLLTVDGRVVAQVTFTELTLPRTISDAQLAAGVDASGFRWSKYQPGQQLTAGAAAPEDWSANRLPPGFHMTARATQKMPGESRPVAHLVFSDGVARVSAFVESGAGNGDENSPGATLAITSESQVGSSSTYSTVVQGSRITVIGEVPPDTVRAIGEALRPGGGDGATGRVPRVHNAAGNRPAAAAGAPPR